MKDVARDIRGFIVHSDVTDNAHQQTTSGLPESDHATVFSRDRNRNRKLTSVSIYNADKETVLQPLSNLKEIGMTSLNRSADSNNNSRVYNDSTANNSTANIRQVTASGKTALVRTRRMVTTSTQTSASRKHPICGLTTSPTVATTWVHHRADCTAATACDNDEVRTICDQSNYSGVYERDLEQVLESEINTGHAVHRRTDQLNCWLSSDVQCDSDSEHELHWSWTSDELDSSDEDATAAAADSASFYYRLCFLFNGSTGPEMADVEP